MQGPTHSRLHVRDTRDAHTVFEAVRKGLLQPIQHRLSQTERSAHIHSGAIFVWEESDDETGLKRWTDGRVWTQSRMREPYLFYDERLPSEPYHTTNDPSRPPTYRFVDSVSRSGSTSAMSHYDRSSQHPMGLVKQTISAQVLLAPNTRPRKWHLTAYFTYSDLPNIPTVEQDPILRKLVVPQGIYLSGKSRSRNSDGGMTNRSTSSPPPSSPQMGSTYYPLYPSPSSPRTHASAHPTLPSIHAAVPDMRYGHSPHSRAHPVRRLSEDQRMIQMLNSRHIT